MLLKFRILLHIDKLRLYQFLVREPLNGFVFQIDLSNQLHRDHPFKTSALLRGGGVNNLPNLPTDSSKKLPMVGG